jgi:hypothetical protein
MYKELDMIMIADRLFLGQLGFWYGFLGRGRVTVVRVLGVLGGVGSQSTLLVESLFLWLAPFLVVPSFGGAVFYFFFVPC